MSGVSDRLDPIVPATRFLIFLLILSLMFVFGGLVAVRIVVACDEWLMKHTQDEANRGGRIPSIFD